MVKTHPNKDGGGWAYAEERVSPSGGGEDGASANTTSGESGSGSSGVPRGEASADQLSGFSSFTPGVPRGEASGVTPRATRRLSNPGAFSVVPGNEPVRRSSLRSTSSYDDHSHCSGLDNVTSTRDLNPRSSPSPDPEAQPDAYVAHAYVVDDDEAATAAAEIPHDVPSPRHSIIRRDGPTEDVIRSLLRTDAGGGCESSLPPAITVLAGMGGLGKSVVASGVVHSADVLRAFSDGVSWLSLGSSKLTPVSYRDRLLTICSHVALNQGNFLTESEVVPRLECFAFSSQDDDRSAQADCARLKAMLAPLMVKKKILIVLDDVWHREDLELFFFGQAERSPCRILVTTRKFGILEGARVPHGPVIRLELPSESEALRLLEQVSGKELEEEDPDTVGVIQRCHRLPLAIASVGLLLRGSATFEPLSMVEVSEFLSGAGGLLEPVSLQDTNFDDSSASCYHIIDRTFEVFGEAAEALRMCFAAFCACFTTQEGIRASVPQVAVLCFFDELLAGVGSYLNKEQRSNLSCSPGERQNDLSVTIIEKLLSVGLLDMDRGGGNSDLAILVVHHDLQQEYGMKAAIKLEQILKKRHPSSSRSCKGSLVSMARSRASVLVVKCYEKRAARAGRKRFPIWKRYDWASVVGDDRRYMLESLVNHMIVADQNKKALQLLKNLPFVSSRVGCFGALKHAERLNEEVKLIMRGMPGEKMTLRGWLPMYSIMDEALVMSFIQARSQDEKTRLWLAGEEAKHRACIWQPWLFRIEVFHSSSPVALLYRRFKAKHCKKMHTLLVEAGHGQHPMAKLWKANYLLWKRDFDDALRVHKQILARKREMLGEDHALILCSMVFIIYVNMVRGAYEEASSVSESVLEAVKAKYGTGDSVELAFAICFTGECRWREGRREDCVESFEVARDMYDRYGYMGEIRTLIDERLATMER